MCIADPVMQLRCANANSNTQVQLWFSETIDSWSAEQTENFNIPGLTIYSSYREGLLIGSERVILNTSQMEFETYTVEVGGLYGTSGNTMDPAYSTFDLRGFDRSKFYYEKFRWMGNSVGYGIWTIFTEPSNTIYNRTVNYLDQHLAGTGIILDEYNYSVSGAEILDLTQVQLPQCVADEPDLVVLEIGGNDWNSTLYETFIDLFDQLLYQLTSNLPETKVMAGNIYDAVLNNYPGGGGGYTLVEWNAAIDSIGQLYDVDILDVYTPLLGHSQTNGWYICYDGLHPNTCGYVYLSTFGLDLMQKTPQKPMNFDAVMFTNYLQFEVDYFPEDELTTSVQIFMDGEYLTTVERDGFPFSVNYELLGYQLHEFRARSETDVFSPDFHYSSYTQEVIVDLSNLLVENNEVQPRSFTLYPAMPNPFNNETTLRYSLPIGTESAVLTIYDYMGRKIISQKVDGGFGSFTWNAEIIPSGVYYAILRSGGYNCTQKLVLIK